MTNLTISFDPALVVLGAAALWLTLRRKPVINVNVSAPVVNVAAPELPQPVIKVLVPSDISRVAADQHRASILHRQPDGSWQAIGHADFESRENPGDRIKLELATEGRAVQWPDGTVQEN